MTVRYVVTDAVEAAAFYVEHLGFEEVMASGSGFALLQRGGLRLALNAPGAGGGGTAGDQTPQPGGWNRFQVAVDDLDRTVAALHDAGVAFRGKITEGKGGRQVLIDDPSANPVELFEPAG